MFHRERASGMPIIRYIVWVGTSLVALLFLVGWLVPPAEPEPVAHTMDKPEIRIASLQRPPERVFIDTNQPTIVPAPAPAADVVQPQAAQAATLEAYAAAPRPSPVVEMDRHGRKAARRHGSKVAARQSPSPGPPSMTSEGSARTFALTKLSFADIVSGRLVKSLLHLQ